MVSCGPIIWETKNTKAWNSAWIDKLKDDQRVIGANLAVLVSTELPEGIKTFGEVDGVWVTSVFAYIPLATALRQHLVQVSFVRSASTRVWLRLRPHQLATHRSHTASRGCRRSWILP
jgi:hypothetical protein